MRKTIESYLQAFRSCFNRIEAFSWFVMVVLAFILRSDHLGVTSVIRALGLDGKMYDSLIKFFRADSYSTDNLRKQWYHLVGQSGLVLKENNRTLLLGDGVKQSKEGDYMPGVKKLHQESEDSSKGEYIFGHLFGAVGVVIGSIKHNLCVPLRMSIQDGLQAAAKWNNSPIPSSSHVVQMIENGFETAHVMGDCLLVLDRYFLSIPALRRMKELNHLAGRQLVEVITKAKRSCTAYEYPPARKPGTKGRKRVKGEKVCLRELFQTHEKDFVFATVYMYGADQKVSYLCKDLLWGQGLYMPLRFVLVRYNGTESILVSTDGNLSPEKIIQMYSIRQKIECCFREFKQQIGGFGYHFWTKSIAKLNHFKTKEEPENIAFANDDESSQERVLKTIDATERFVHMGCIAMGIIQMLLMSEKDVSDIQNCRYLRTKTEKTISEATMLYYLRSRLLVVFAKCPESFVTKIIMAHTDQD